MADYSLEGPLWSSTTVTYSFATANYGGQLASFSDPLSDAAFQADVRSAFARWSEVANIHFLETADAANVDVRVGQGNFDGPFGVLGETEYSYDSNGEFRPGTIVRFDEGENWSLRNGHPYLSSGVSFYSVALHEIGHALGLGHYNAAPAIMNASASASVADLKMSDIDGIDALYGAHVVTVSSSLTDIGSHGLAWPVAGVGDFNADGTSDVLWRDPGTGQVDQWQMQGGHWSKSIDLGANKNASWQLAGTGDFNADGVSDVIWRNTATSQVDEWQMKNGNWSKSIDLGANKGANWQLAGVGDFNGDGTADVVWRDVSTSHVDEWQMKNGNWSKSVDLGANKDAAWQLAGVGDFNGDGTADVLWRNVNTSQVDEWQMKNGNWSRSIDLGATKGADWKVAGIGDFNGDGNSDIMWFNTKTGQAEHWQMANGNWSASVSDGILDTALQPAGVGDFNHDGKSEAVFLDPSTSHLYDLIV